jgi:iron complex outermembrane receptor protein
MERVEVLEGPQGTLFGGGAEAGAVRYITNKPKLNVTEGSTRSQLRRHCRRRPEQAASTRRSTCR